MKLTINNSLLALISFIVLGPFLVLIFKSFSLPTKDLEAWNLVIGWLPELFLNSALLLVATLTMSSLFGCFAALVIGLTDIPYKKTLRILFLLPIAVPLYILSFVYLGIFEYSGELHTFLRSIGLDIHYLIPIKSFLGVGFVFSLGLYPYVYLITLNALEQLGYDQIKSSLSLGRSRFETLKLVILPSIKPAIICSMIILAMETLADFGGVSAFNYDTFTTSIYHAWATLFSFHTAARLSLILLSLTLIFFWFEKRFMSRTDNSNSTIAKMPPLFKLSRKQSLTLSFFSWGLLFFALFLPVLTLFTWAYNALNIEWDYHYLSLIKNSLLFSLFALIPLILIGMFFSLVKRSGARKLQRNIINLCMLGYAVPGNIIATAVFIAFASFIYLLGFKVTVIVSIICLTTGYLIRFLNVSHRNIEGPLNLIPKELDRSSQSLGITGLRMWKKIHFPLLLPSFGGISVLLFLEVLKEMPMTLMLRPTGYDTLAVKIYELTSEGEWQRAAVGGALLVMIALSSTLLFQRKLGAGANA